MWHAEEHGKKGVGKDYQDAGTGTSQSLGQRLVKTGCFPDKDSHRKL